MNTYHKIETVLQRDPETNYKTMTGYWAKPEFEYLKDNEWVFTEKVDGTNIRVMWLDGKVKFGGKTDNAQLPSRLVTRLQETFTVDKLAKLFGETPVCMYGEGYGAGIQKGGVYRPDQDFVLFDILIYGYWLTRDKLEAIASDLGIDIVPIIATGTLPDMLNMAREGFTSQWGDFIAEGIVARPAIELTARDGSRIITKIKHKDFR